MNNFLTIGAFSLAVTSFAYPFLNDKKWCIFILFTTYIILYLISYIEKLIKKSKGDLLDKALYFITRNREPYLIDYTEAKYIYKSKNEMEYHKRVDLISRTNYLTRYPEKFCWSSYSSDIKVLPMETGQKINYMPSKNFWTIIDIEFNQRIKKRDTISSGMMVMDLKDEIGLSKPFLSLENDKKVKHRKMMVIIPKDLKPCNARFEVYPSHNQENIIKSEAIEYNEAIGGYEKSIPYPRKGRTYSIIWEWEK